MAMRTGLLLVVIAGVLVACIAAAGGGALWLKKQLRSPDYCASCHAVASQYQSWKSSPFLAHTHAKLGLTCQSCHQRTLLDGVRELASTVTRSYQLPLKDHPVDPAACLTCHGSYKLLAARTQDLKGPDGFALGRNPHDSHWGALQCGVCHKMHKPSVDFCSKCHLSPMQGPAWEVALPSSMVPIADSRGKHDALVH
jgi:hypothetical protein